MSVAQVKEKQLAQWPAWGRKLRLQSGRVGTVWGHKQQLRQVERQQEQPGQRGNNLTSATCSGSLFSSHNKN